MKHCDLQIYYFETRMTQIPSGNADKNACLTAVRVFIFEDQNYFEKSAFTERKAFNPLLPASRCVLMF